MDLCRLRREPQLTVPRELGPPREARLAALTAYSVRSRARVLDDAIVCDQIIQEPRIVQTESVVVQVVG